MARQCDGFGFLLFHQLGHRLANKKSAFGIDVHHSVVVGLAGLSDRNVFRNVDSGGVDAVVNPAEFFRGVVDHRLHRVRAAHVHFYAQGFVALVRGYVLALFCGVGGGVCAHICEEHTGCARFGECEACFFPDTSSALYATGQHTLAECWLSESYD